MLKSGKLVAKDTCNKLLEEIEHKVFEIETTMDRLKFYQDNYRISNLYHDGDKIVVRTVTDSPPQDEKITAVKPALEDLYLYVFEEGV